mmetsp:Transcript_29190/g.56406  ORF Transcript_29190/g.56406 Transcript_29190/m.56406 type:complete len:571 (-) Transcript_29190:919-2631(-)
MFGIEGTHALFVLAARLVADTQVAQAFHRQAGDGGRDHVAEDARALTAADDQQFHRVVARRDIARPGPIQHSAAHGVAHMHAFDTFGQSGGPGPAGDRIHAFGQEVVDPTQNTVLFMDHPGQAQERSGGHGRDRWIAAKANDNRRPVTPHLDLGRGDAGQNAKGNGGFGQQSTARKGGGRDLLNLGRVGKATSIARATGIGAELDAPAAGQHRFGQGLGGEHMPAGAACRDEQEGLFHRIARKADLDPPSLRLVICAPHFIDGPFSSTAPPQQIRNLALRPGPGEGQQHAHCNARGDHGRPAIGHEWQGHPLGGQEAHGHAHVDHGLNAKHASQTGARQPNERVAFAHKTQERADHDACVEQDDAQHEDQAIFFSRHRNDKIGMGIGQRPFHLPLAHTHAKEATLLDRVGGIAQLGTRIDIRAEKAVNTAGEMLRIRIGDCAAQDHQPCHADQQQHGRTGDKVHHGPAKQDQTGLTKVWLQGQHENDGHTQRKGPRLARRAVQVLAGGHHPGRSHHKSGLEKLRRLERPEAKRIPAHRSFAEIRAKEGQQGQGNKSHQESQHRQSAHDHR